jgi:hypothetical protein
MIYKNRIYKGTKAYQFKHDVKDDKYVVVKPQISRFRAKKSCQVMGFNVLRWFSS